MRLPQRATGTGLKFNLTPMIDVVFNLIIFFLAASHLARSEIAADVELPTAVTGGPEEARLARRLTVTVFRDGTLMVGAGPMAYPQVEQMILEGNTQSAGSAREFEVRIRTDRHAAYRNIEPLLVACAQAGVTRIRLAVLPARAVDD